MDLLTQRYLASLRETLLDRARQLQDEVHVGDLAGRGGAGERETRDFKDEAARRAHDAVGAREVQRDIDELRQVQAALYRLDAGVYGDCIDCGEPIVFARLRVHPAAERCAACQMIFETGAGAASAPAGDTPRRA
ncbi:MAG: conjugal transfer protein TraR [Burkholderiaceae bacterium]|nr:MAG: conjugal transfer protein TraR [Burkholderiaceae bacterium]